ncbi:MAG: hypothetical protein KAJ14_00890, partial [Candidatus Omnitrophica bacterium]|nr:hypothetical protein [Candidatus Omnitrophota bacterium]
CAVINMGLLMFWFLILVYAHDWVYRVHRKWFEIPIETFNSIHYAGMTFFKIAIFVFNIIPYFVLHIVT